MYIYRRTNTYLYTYIYTHDTYVCVYIYTYVYIYIYIHMIHTCVCVYIYTYVYIYIYICTIICVCIYMYIHTLVICYIATENYPFIDDLPIISMASLHVYVRNNKRLQLEPWQFRYKPQWSHQSLTISCSQNLAFWVYTIHHPFFGDRFFFRVGYIH